MALQEWHRTERNSWESTNESQYNVKLSEFIPAHYFVGEREWCFASVESDFRCVYEMINSVEKRCKW
jgi:hypothetical protein